MSPRLLILPLLAISGLFAQSNPVLDSMIRGIEMRQQIERTKARQRELQLQEQQNRRDQERHDLEMKRLPEQRPQEQGQNNGSSSGLPSPTEVNLAVQQVRGMYPDFDQYESAMTPLIGGLMVDTSKMTTAQYVESLYLIAKHATFTAAARERIEARTAPKPQ